MYIFIYVCIYEYFMCVIYVFVCICCSVLVFTGDSGASFPNFRMFNQVFRLDLCNTECGGLVILV